MSNERLVFGQIPPEEVTFRRRSQAARRKSPENQEVYKDFQVMPLIEAALRADWRRWQEQTEQRRAEQKRIFEPIYGRGVKIPEYLHPSTVSFCLRWVAYKALDYQETEPTIESLLAMKMGSAIHWSLSNTIKKYLPGEAETNVVIDDPDVSGRIDFFFPHPRLKGQYQIWEFKSVSDYAFRQVKREGLPEYLRGTKRIYQPSPEHRKQVLLYMWGKRSQNVDVVCANIIYINRSDGKRKEALVPWDELARYDVEECLIPQIKETQMKIEKLREEIKQTDTRINEEEIPEPTVESTHVCARFCPFRGYCERGQKFAAGAERRRAKRKPQYVYQKLKQDAQATRVLMVEAGLVQDQLPAFRDSSEPPPKSTPAARKEIVKPERLYNLNEEVILETVCGECGASLRENCRLVKQRARKSIVLVEKTCPHHGVISAPQKSILNKQLIGLPKIK